MPNLKTLELQETRTISGTGSLKFPGEVSRLRYARLNIDVIREVAEPFNSYKYSPARSRYATLAFMKNGYVIAEAPVDYKRRQFDFEMPNATQNLIAIQCQYQGILDSFANLGTALNLVVIQKDNDIKEYQPLSLVWDEVQIVCEGSTAIEVKIYTQELEECEDLPPEPLDEPPPPEPPQPPVPPNEGLEVSPPYDPDDPNEPFNPDGLDQIEEPPPPPEPPGNIECVPYIVEYEYRFSEGSQLTSGTLNMWGIEGGIEGIVGLLQGVTTFYIVSGGLVGSFPPCNGEERITTIASNNGGFDIALVTSVEPA